MRATQETIQYQPDEIKVKPLEVWGHTKNFSLIVEVERFGQKSKSIYYPEKGIRFAIDTRVPKPYEVRHHIAYSALCEMLGWDVAIPAMPFSLKDDDHGALSPFYDHAEVKPHYYFEKLQPNETWLKVAALDYLAGLIDRTSNDVLFLPDGTVKVTDNGLSFVEGTDFSTQISVVRQALRGISLPNNLLQDVSLLDQNELQYLSQFLYSSKKALDSVFRRQDRLMDQQVVL